MRDSTSLEARTLPPQEECSWPSLLISPNPNPPGVKLFAHVLGIPLQMAAAY